MKRYKVYGRRKKNLSQWDIAQEHVWNATPGVYDRYIFADNATEAKKLYKQSAIGGRCVVEHVEEI